MPGPIIDPKDADAEADAKDRERQLRFVRTRRERRPLRARRGVSLLPSLFTMGNMFCGYACMVFAMRGDFESAAPYIGIAIVLDMLDGRIARLTGTASEFGVQLDSLADAISFGVAPAILASAWGLTPLGRLGGAAGFMYVSAAVLRLARFNIQSAAGGDKRYFVGLPSPAAAGLIAATVYAYPYGLHDYRAALPVLALVLGPALLMVSTIRFRSFKTIDLQMRRPYTVDSYRRLVDLIVERLPHASIGSDMIAGFPGETAQDFARNLDYLPSAPLSHLHVFPYSDRPGTEAEAMGDQGALGGVAGHRRRAGAPIPRGPARHRPSGAHARGRHAGRDRQLPQGSRAARAAAQRASASADR